MDAQEYERVKAAVFALPGCPTGHLHTESVDDLNGERVATLCLDCDGQLPAQWEDALEYEHKRDHHRHWSALLPHCRLCVEERGWSGGKARKADAT